MSIIQTKIQIREAKAFALEYYTSEKRVTLNIQASERVALLSKTAIDSNHILTLLAQAQNHKHYANGELDWSADSLDRSQQDLEILSSHSHWNYSQSVLQNLVPSEDYELRSLAFHYLNILGAEDFAETPIKELRYGTQQALAFIRNLIHQPGAVLADDFLNELDGLTRARIRCLISKIWESDPFTLIFTTWDISEALLLADRILLVDEQGIAGDWKHFLPADRHPNTLDFRNAEEYLSLSLCRGHFLR